MPLQYSVVMSKCVLVDKVIGLFGYYWISFFHINLQASEMEVCKEAAISLKGSKGQGLRDKFNNELEVSAVIR